MLKYEKSLQAFISLLLVFAVSSCASYTDETRQMALSFQDGLYPQALEQLDKTGLKEQDRNKLLYTLNRSMILDRLGRREDSRGLLLQADKIVDRLFTKSISKEVATYLYNEGAQAYPGEDYEKVAIHTILAHSFLEDGDFAAARVEAAKINTRLSEINSFYEENKNKYKEDAYARYLAGLVYEALGEFDAAIVDYRAALRVYESDYSKHFDTAPPKQIVEALHKLLLRRGRKDEARALQEKHQGLLKAASPEQNAEIIVIHELGLIANKESSEFIYPIGREIVRFSFPVIRKRAPLFGKTGLEIMAGNYEAAELGQNFDSIAAQTLEDRRFRIMAKSAARLIMKSQITQKAEREFGPIGYLVGSLYGAVTETADTRSWNLLPAAVSITRVSVKPGSYELKIFNNSKVSQIKKVSVKSGQFVIIRDY